MKNRYSYSPMNKISRSGLIETVYIMGLSLFGRVRSFFSILGLRMRGYDIHTSVMIGMQALFFQSQQHSIRVLEGTAIGNGVRLKAGFAGEIHIGRNVLIEDFTSIYAHKTLTIGDNTMISTGCFITDFDHNYPHSKFKHLLLSEDGYTAKTTTIGKNVWIGTNCCILKGVAIGDDAVIGAGSVVTKSVPAGHVAVGVPAHTLGKP